jgi:hypothetical protein
MKDSQARNFSLFLLMVVNRLQSVITGGIAYDPDKGLRAPPDLMVTLTKTAGTGTQQSEDTTAQENRVDMLNRLFRELSMYECN